MENSEQQILKINTAEGTFKTEKIKFSEIPVLDGKNGLLKTIIPEYTGGFPNPVLENFITELKKTKSKYGGFGIAANQCGYPLRMIIITNKDYTKFNSDNLVCINPKIIKEYDTKNIEREGCLSFPGLFLKIKRSTKIDVEFTDQDGEVIQTTFTGATARCFQHELDHLNGITFKDRVGGMSLMLANKKREKLIKKIKRKGEK